MKLDEKLNTSGSIGSGTSFYFDYQNGSYGFNTSANRGADTFNPFKSGGAIFDQFVQPENVSVGNNYSFSYNHLHEDGLLFVYALNTATNGWGPSAPNIVGGSIYKGTYTAYSDTIRYIIKVTSSTVTLSGTKPNTAINSIIGMEYWGGETNANGTSYTIVTNHITQNSGYFINGSWVNAGGNFSVAGLTLAYNSNDVFRITNNTGVTVYLMKNDATLTTPQELTNGSSTTMILPIVGFTLNDSYEGLMTLDLGALQTDATSTTITRTVDKDCIFFGVGGGSNDSVYLNGSSISGVTWWSFSGVPAKVYSFKATAGSTLRIANMRYCFIS